MPAWAVWAAYFVNKGMNGLVISVTTPHISSWLSRINQHPFRSRCRSHANCIDCTTKESGFQISLQSIDATLSSHWLVLLELLPCSPCWKFAA